MFTEYTADASIFLEQRKQICREVSQINLSLLGSSMSETNGQTERQTDELTDRVTDGRDKMHNATC